MTTIYRYLKYLTYMARDDIIRAENKKEVTKNEKIKDAICIRNAYFKSYARFFRVYFF